MIQFPATLDVSGGMWGFLTICSWGWGGQRDPKMGRLSPASVGGEEVGVFHARPGLGHHGGDGVAPALVVRRLLVRGRRLGGAIGLDEDKARRVVRLLDDVEPGDAGFDDRLQCILQARGLEGVDAPGFYVNVNMNNEHGEMALKDG